MKLTDYMTKDMIILDLKASSPEVALHQLIDVLESEGRITNKSDYYKALVNREAQSSTAIGFEVAIPHGKTDAVILPSVVFAKAPEGIEWESLDGDPVKLVFMIGVPEEAAGNEHLRILALLSRRLIDDSFRESLKAAMTVDEIHAQLSTVEG